MFSGIVEEVGAVLDIQALSKSKSFKISSSHVLEGCAIGDSISVNGVCLTVTEKDNDTFSVDIIDETLKCTSLNGLQKGSRVNLERALTYNDRISGHLVQGHIDGIAKVHSINQTNEWTEIEFLINLEHRKYCIHKGSIAIDGVSLTIAKITESGIKVALIPHTLENTILSDYEKNKEVNIELDMVGKYIESFSNYR